MRGSVETSVLSIEPPPALLAFVQRQISQADHYAGEERRAENRHFLGKAVLVYPADENFSPTGPSRVMVIRDISPRGLALVHEEQLDWPLVLVRISLPDMESLVGGVVRWTRPAGPFYITGCAIHEQFDSVFPDN